MYVCLCYAVTEKELDAAIEGGARSLGELEERLHVSSCCGACVRSIEECLARRVAADETIAA